MMMTSPFNRHAANLRSGFCEKCKLYHSVEHNVTFEIECYFMKYHTPSVNPFVTFFNMYAQLATLFHYRTIRFRNVKICRRETVLQGM